MNERIKELRKELGLTLEKFGGRLGVGKNAISRIETRKSNVTDQMFKSICREFNVNDEWLRTGEGDMFNLPLDETAAIVADILDESNPLYDLILSIAKTYQQLDDSSRKVINDAVLMLYNNMTVQKKED